MIVADSSVWIDYLRQVPTPGTEQLDSLLGRRCLLVGDLILCEILRGARSEADASRIERKLSALPFAAMVGGKIAVEAARNYRLLRSRGITIHKTVDLLIGTFCIVNDHHLLHNDSDFKPMVEHLGLMEA